jgi:hypothetical protein
LSSKAGSSCTKAALMCAYWPAGKTCCVGLGPSVPSLLAIGRRHSDADRVAPLPLSFAPAGIAPLRQPKINASDWPISKK